ncbi:MAG: zinc-ribbon domain-containing protein [Anaerolineae bacterium]
MPTCPNCGSQQLDGASFCDECGAALNDPQVAANAPSAGQVAPTVVASSTCPMCGAQVSAQDPFCPNCGASLSSPAPPSGGQQGLRPEPTVVAQQAYQPASAQAPASGLVCSNCGAHLEPDSAFCDMCGAPVSGQAGAQQDETQVSGPAGQAPVTPEPAQAWSPSSSTDPVPPEASFPPQAVVTPVQQAVSEGRLFVHGMNISLPFPPGKEVVTIGREDPVSQVFPDIDLTDYGGDEGGVSRMHARISLQGGQFYIEDLDSTNYTFLNQERLQPRQRYPLEDEDEVRFGRVKATFYAS